MAVESNLTKIGWCAAGFDGRNSTNTGTTQGGPLGSAQFLAARFSSTADRTIMLCTVATQKPIGILQNKPRLGEAADVAVFGVSKAVAGSTAIAPGDDLMVDTDGQLIPFVAGASVRRFAQAVEAAAAVGQVFSAFVYGAAGGGGSTA